LIAWTTRKIVATLPWFVATNESFVTTGKSVVPTCGCFITITSPFVTTFHSFITTEAADVATSPHVVTNLFAGERWKKVGFKTTADVVTKDPLVEARKTLRQAWRWSFVTTLILVVTFCPAGQECHEVVVTTCRFLAASWRDFEPRRRLPTNGRLSFAPPIRHDPR